MGLKMKCPRCKSYAEYVKDKDAEELGFYGFDCKECGEEFMTPKVNPDIIED